MSDRTQDLKNLRAVATACKNYTDKKINDLQWQLGTYDLSVDTDTDVAHIKTLPSGTIQTTVAKVDGVGYKVNQLVANGNFSNSTGWSATNGTISVSGNVLTYTQTTASGSNRIVGNVLGTVLNHKYLTISKIMYLDNMPNNTIFVGSGGYDGTQFNTNKITALNTWCDLYDIFTRSSSDGDDRLSIYPRLPNANDRVSVKLEALYDLTADFGSGNEPSTVNDCASAYLQRGINIYEYTPQQSSIKNNAFTGVTIKDSNDNITETISVDLTTIKDSNNVSLFPSGKLMGNSSVADFITPYNQESRWNEVDLGSLNWERQVKLNASSEYKFVSVLSATQLGIKVSTSNFKCVLYESGSVNEQGTNMVMAIGSYINIVNNTYQTAEAFKTAMTGIKLQYERATYLTSTTDLTSLTGIQGQSNGTITLNNTDNVDMPNTVKSLKEVAK